MGAEAKPPKDGTGILLEDEIRRLVPVAEGFGRGGGADTGGGGDSSHDSSKLPTLSGRVAPAGVDVDVAFVAALVGVLGALAARLGSTNSKSSSHFSAVFLRRCLGVAGVEELLPAVLDRVEDDGFIRGGMSVGSSEPSRRFSMGAVASCSQVLM